MFVSTLQALLTDAVRRVFSRLVGLLAAELDTAHNTPHDDRDDADAGSGLVTVLSALMARVRRCRLHASLTIQLMSALFRHIRCSGKTILDGGLNSIVQHRFTSITNWIYQTYSIITINISP